MSHCWHCGNRAAKPRYTTGRASFGHLAHHQPRRFECWPNRVRAGSLRELDRRNPPSRHGGFRDRLDCGLGDHGRVLVLVATAAGVRPMNAVFALLPASQGAGVLACWRAGVLACWRAGVLACLVAKLSAPDRSHRRECNPPRPFRVLDMAFAPCCFAGLTATCIASKLVRAILSLGQAIQAMAAALWVLQRASLRKRAPRLLSYLCGL